MLVRDTIDCIGIYTIYGETHQGDKCYLFLLFGHHFFRPQLHLTTISFIFQQGDLPKLDLQIDCGSDFTA